MDNIEILLTRGVERIYPSKEALEKVLRSGKKLRVYQGFDPTGIKLHIGHLVGLRKLRQFQEAGHEVIFLIGDGTGQAGDPSGKTRGREKFLSQDELRKNAKDYVMQAAKIINFTGKNAVRIMYNGDWLNKLTLPEILKIVDYFSAQQLFERDLFQQRIKRGETINVREFLYPIFQAYDSVFLNIDLEIGGNDQTFNMLAGRDLVYKMQKREKFVLTTPLLTDSQGRKIGKTEGNVIALMDNPNDLYGKIMNLGDDIIVKGLEYLTDIPREKIEEITKKIKSAENPMPFKKLLAFEVVKSLNSLEEARKAQEFFELAHQRRQIEKLDNIPVVEGASKTIEEVVVNYLSLSKSSFKQLIQQRSIDINSVTISDPNKKLSSGDIVQVGKKHIFKIK